MKKIMKKNIYYIDINRVKTNTAGSKAKDDIAEICKNEGYKRIVLPTFPENKSKIYKKMWLLFWCPINWLKILFRLPKNSIVLFQHPMYGNRYSNMFIPVIQKLKNVKFIAIIHDLESLRKGIEGIIQNNDKTNNIADNILLKHMNQVICHNEEMKKYLLEKGFLDKKLVTLGIFDYLTDEENNIQTSDENSVSIAGNLATGKSGYIYELIDNLKGTDIKLNLYGNNFDESMANENCVWHGSYPAEKLPGIISGKFGIVWDGPVTSECKGNTGEYLKYNNPHKTSLYLVSGMPVIIWKKAAMSKFVEKENIGITVSFLEQIKEVLDNLDETEYKIMKKNALEISEKLKEGFYFKEAFYKAIANLEKNVD